MSDDITVFTAGTRTESGNYSNFIESKNEAEVDEYINIMKGTKSEGSAIVKMHKLYRCISTTPFIIK